MSQSLHMGTDEETAPASPATEGPSAESRRARRLEIGLTIALIGAVVLLVWLVARILTALGDDVPAPADGARPNPVSPGFQPLSIWFEGPERGLISGSIPCEDCEDGHGGLIASTADGGATWTERFRADRPILGLARVGETGIVGATATHCRDAAFVGCDLGPLRSDDLGTTWERGPVRKHLWRSPPTPPVPCLPDHPYAVSSSFPTRKLGWVLCGYTATSASYQFKGLYQTRDGGRGRWRELPEFQPRGQGVVNPSNMPVDGFAWGISFLRNGHGWMWTLNRYSTLSATRNEGMEWDRIWRVESGRDQSALSASLFAKGSGYLLIWDREDGSTLLLTRDGGRAWETAQRWPPAPLPISLGQAGSPSGGA